MRPYIEREVVIKIGNELHIIAMAEKRAMDRAILKGIDAYRLFYSNVELDDEVKEPGNLHLTQ